MSWRDGGEHFSELQFGGGGGGLRDEAPCGVPELRVTQASVSTRQLKRGIKEELDCLVQHRKQRVCTV